MTASLVDTLNLQLTAGELSASEWSCFLSKMGKTFILRAIRSLNANDIKNATSRMKQIIQSRDEIPPNALAKAGCIDQLSSSLIGEIGSYLDVDEYGRFEQCNRTLYVSCNSPNKVQEIRLPFAKTNNQMKHLKLCKYSSVRILYCFNKNVRKLNIPEAMNSVTKLCFDNKSAGFTSSDFFEFVSKFPSAESLHVYHLRISAVNHDQNMIKMLPPNVKKLGLCAQDFMADVIKFYANQVEELRTAGMAYLNVKRNSLHFSQLFYLDVGWIGTEDHGAVKHILNNAPKLKHIRSGLYDISNWTEDLTMLFAHKALEVIESEIEWSAFESFCDAFEFVSAQYPNTPITRFELSFDLYSERETGQHMLRVIKSGLEKLYNALQKQDIQISIDFREEGPVDLEAVYLKICEDELARITKKYISKIYVTYWGERIY